MKWTTSLVKLQPSRWSELAKLFEHHIRTRIHIDCMLEGYLGEFGGHVSMLTDSESDPHIAQIKIGTEILLGGDAMHPAAGNMIAQLPKTASVSNWQEGFYGALVIPESDIWEDLIKKVYGDKIARHQRVEYSSDQLGIDYLRDLRKQLPAGFEIKRFDSAMAQKYGHDIDRVGMAYVSLRGCTESFAMCHKDAYFMERLIRSLVLTPPYAQDASYDS